MHRSDIPETLVPAITSVGSAAHAYAFGLSFIVHDTGRDPDFARSHLLATLSHDLLQSALALPMLVTEGMWSVARRELRFILEASIKQATIQQASYKKPVLEKISEFAVLLNSPSVSCKNRLTLDLIPQEDRERFLQELGKLYGAASEYVHLTERQVRTRLSAVESGHTAGFESREEALEASLLIAKTLAASLALLFHSVPGYVAGDFFVAADGRSPEWFFEKSRYLVGIDSYFDYKHERKSLITTIAAERSAKIEF